MDDSETLLANMTLPPTPTSVIIGNLIAGSSYSIRAAAWTVAGVGPASEPASFTMEVLSFQQHPQVPTLKGDQLDDDDTYGQFDNRGRGQSGQRDLVHSGHRRCPPGDAVSSGSRFGHPPSVGSQQSHVLRTEGGARRRKWLPG